MVAERGKASLSPYQSERAQYANCWVGCLDCSLRLEVWKDEEGHLSMTSVLVSQEWCVGEAEDPPYERATAARNLPNVPLVGAQAGFSPMSNMSGYVHVHPTGSPVIGTPVSGSPASSAQPLKTPPGLGSPVPPVPQQQQRPSLERQLLVQTVQQQQQQITQMMTLVETLVSRQQPVHGPENRPQAAELRSKNAAS